MDDSAYSVEFAAYFEHPVERIYDACFGAVGALRLPQASTGSLSVYSRGLPHMRPEDDWHRFRHSGLVTDLHEDARTRLPPEPEIGSCHVEGADDRWAVQYSRSDRIDDMPIGPFLHCSYDAGDPLSESPPGSGSDGSPLTDGLLASQGFFRAADAAGACHFGLADINSNRFQGGHLYGCYPRRPLPWRLEIERVDWHTSGELARTRVRDVYWGVYLSASLLSRLPTDVLDQFLELETEGERPQTVTRYDSGAAFLTMSADPMDAPFPFPYGPECPAVRNAVWLRQRLREAGML